MIIKRNQQFALPVILTDDTDFKTPKTGVDVSAVVCKYVKEGSFALTTKTLRKILYWNQYEDLTGTQNPKIGPTTTVNGSPTWAAKKFGNGIKTQNGSTVEFPTVSASFDFAKGCIEGWIEPDGWSITNGASSADVHSLFRWRDGLNKDMQIEFTPGGITWKMRDGADNSWTGAVTGLTIGDGELAHIAFVWDRTHGTKKRRIFLNDSEVGSNNTAWNDVDMTGAIAYIQSDFGGASWFSGYMDNLKWWDYAKVDFSDKDDENALPDAWIELGVGLYFIVFTAAELDTLGKFIYNVTVASALPYPGAVYIQNYLNDDIGAKTNLILATPTTEANATANTAAIITEINENEGKINTIVGKLPSGDMADESNIQGHAAAAITADAKIEFIKQINGGRWKIIENQMIFYEDDNTTEVVRFNLFDQNGNPSMVNVFDRQKV